MTADRHLSRLEILEIVEGAVDDAENDAAQAHITACAHCFKVYEEVLDLLRVTNDPSTWEPFDEEAERMFAEHRVTLLAMEEDSERDARDADAFLLRIAQEPVANWPTIIGANPHVCTSALAQRLIDLSAPELDRQNPAHALLLLQVAELVAYTLPERVSIRQRGYVWKQRSNALRRLAKYEKAIDAAILAERLFAELDEPDTSFEVGQARYTMAVALVKMMRHPAALQALASARELLHDYGISAPLAKVMMLEAVVRIQQGDVLNARATLRDLLPIEQELALPLEVARVRLNIAECNLRLGALDEATTEAATAIKEFHAAGNVAEETRAHWTVAMIRLARGEHEALMRLYEVAAVYQMLGMPGEEGFVKLDIAAELVEREQWTEAEPLARELVTLFTAAGVTLASVNALHFLRTAVENRTASRDTVLYVRSYVAADSGATPFEPPRLSSSN
jgi:tetratricopeptide (TPR) repeat protein